MASERLINLFNGYEDYITSNGIDLEVIRAMKDAVGYAFVADNDRNYGLKISQKTKKAISVFVYQQSGGTLWDLEKFCFEHDDRFEILDLWYDVLLLEARERVFDSYLLYLEKKRLPKERFYMPKRKQLAKFGLIDAYQGAIDDIYDIVLISMPPGTGKTTLLKFFNSAVIGWFPKDFNLFYSHSGDITRMYYDGVYQMVTDDQEYTWHDIFPDLSVTSTNAKMGQFNVGKYKAFPSLQTASVGSEMAGKVRASKFLLSDDLIGKIEEALNKATLEKRWMAYTTDARQRKTVDTDQNPCKEIMQATRWSVADPIGRLIVAYEGSPRVKVISMPDIDEKTGESNFDYEYGGFSVAFFKDQQKLMDDISYKCLYKQQPIEREGLLYHEDELRRYISLPEEKPDAVLAVCDTKTTGIDYMFLPVFYQYGNDYYLVDCICDNSTDFDIQIKRIVEILVHHKVQKIEFESNAGGSRLAYDVENELKERGYTFCSITTKPTETNKETRIIVNADWIKKQCLFKIKDDYSNQSDYGRMMDFLLSYSISGKNRFDDVCDGLANFRLFVENLYENHVARIIKSPI